MSKLSFPLSTHLTCTVACISNRFTKSALKISPLIAKSAHEVNDLESSVVIQELELAINHALYVLWSLGNQYNVRTLSWFSLALTQTRRAV